MGLDIHLRVNNEDEFMTVAYFDENHQHQLSREFCNLMCRPGVIDHTPELDQIGALTNTPIEPFYTMSEYPCEEEEIDMLEFAEDEEEKERLRYDFVDRKQAVKNNINEIHSLLDQLITKLNQIDELYEQLLKTDFDSLNSKYYFSNFKTDKGKGYIGNNFGQDLRNFKRFVDFAIEKNAKTIWFEFG